MEWTLGIGGLVVGVLAGSGGLFFYLSTRGQLDLDRAKHSDAITEPRRAFRLQALQNAATAYETAIRRVQAVILESPSYNAKLRQAKADVAAALPAIESVDPHVGATCRSVNDSFASWKPGEDKYTMVTQLQMAAGRVYTLINNL